MKNIFQKFKNIFLHKSKIENNNIARNFRRKTKVYFDSEVFLKIERNNDFKEYYLEPKEKITFLKDDIVNYENLNNDTYSFTKISIIFWFKKIIINNFFKKLQFFFFFLTAISFIILKIPHKEWNWFNSFLLISSLLNFFELFWNFIKEILNKKQIKKYFKNGRNFEQKTVSKNGINLNNYEVICGKIFYKNSIFRKHIYLKFKRSESKLKNIKYNKHNKQFTYDYIQKFNKKSEPNEFLFYKKGHAIFYIDDLKIIYTTEDETRTTGYIKLL